MNSVAVSSDYNAAKVKVYVLQGNNPNGGVVEAEALIDARQARKIAVSLLQAADEAEEQRAHNLKRVRFAMEADQIDLAAQLAEVNGFSDDEINGKV